MAGFSGGILPGGGDCNLDLEKTVMQRLGGPVTNATESNDRFCYFFARRKGKLLTPSKILKWRVASIQIENVFQWVYKEKWAHMKTQSM